MRPICPICHSVPADKFIMDYASPDNWPLPKKYYWLLCGQCGFVWADNMATQDDYNRYYKEHYQNGHITDPHDASRLNNLANAVFGLFKSETSIIDYGAGDCYLQSLLNELGFMNVKICEVGDRVTKCDLIIASQVVEHIYDIDTMMNDFENASMVWVETPDAYTYAGRTDPPMLDYTPDHVNHFGVAQLDRLFGDHNFSSILQHRYEYRATNAPMIRALYQHGVYQSIFERVKAMTKHTALTIPEMPVIIWGLGFQTMYALTDGNWNIAYFVDNDPVYTDATINGIPIKDKVDSDEPIVIMARRSRQKILDKIKELGLTNEVIIRE